jgi:hypothetical protein
VKSRRGKRPIAQINQADANGVPEVLTRFRAAVGVGRVRGPKREEGKIDLYHWVASSRGDVRRTFEAIAPWLGGVKTAQFDHAVGPVSPTGHDTSRDEDLAWAAGLFDGDGSTYFAKHRTHAGYVRAEMAVTQSSRTGEPGVLSRLREILGVGHIGGPYGGNDKWEPVYRWKVYRRIEIEATATSLWPWLGSAKQEQAASVISTDAAQAPLPRGNPTWGNRKTRCVHGHEYDVARIRPYRARSTGGVARRSSKQCLACVREYARRRRAATNARRSR